MKTFKTVEDFLASNPSQNVIDQLMSVINHNAIKELKKEIRSKTTQLKRAERLLNDSTTLGVATDTITEFITTTQKELDEMNKQLPEPKEKVEDKKK